MLIFKSKLAKGYKIYDTDTHSYEVVSQAQIDEALSLGIPIVGLNRKAEIQKARIFSDMYISNIGGMTIIRGNIPQKRIVLSKYVDTLNIDPTSDIGGITFVLDDTIKLGYNKVFRGVAIKLFDDFNVKLDISLLSDSGCRAFYRHILSTVNNNDCIDLVPRVVVDTAKHRNVYANTVVAYILGNTKIDLMSEHTVIRMIQVHLKGEESKVYSLIKQWLGDSNFYGSVYKQELISSGVKDVFLVLSTSRSIENLRGIGIQTYDYCVIACKQERYLYPFLLFCTLGLKIETEDTALTYMQDYARCLLKSIENL